MTRVSPENPEWNEQVLPSGLVIATSAAPAPTAPPALPSLLRPQPPALLVPASAAPQPVDMLLVAPSASDLNYPAATLCEVIELLQDVPFDPATLLVSILAAEIYHHPRDNKLTTSASTRFMANPRAMSRDQVVRDANREETHTWGLSGQRPEGSEDPTANDETRFVLATAHDLLEYVVEGFGDLRVEPRRPVIRPALCSAIAARSPERWRPAPPQPYFTRSIERVSTRTVGRRSSFGFGRAVFDPRLYASLDLLLGMEGALSGVSP
jgi:hypothetical protein